MGVRPFRGCRDGSRSRGSIPPTEPGTAPLDSVRAWWATGVPRHASVSARRLSLTVSTTSFAGVAPRRFLRLRLRNLAAGQAVAEQLFRKQRVGGSNPLASFHFVAGAGRARHSAATSMVAASGTGIIEMKKRPYVPTCSRPPLDFSSPSGIRNLAGGPSVRLEVNGE